MKILLHQNYCRLGGLDNLFALALEVGAAGVEIHRLCRTYEPDPETYRRKAAAFKQAHPEMEIVFSLGTLKLARGPADEVAAGIDARIAFMAWAKRECGTRVFNFFTDPLSTPRGEPHVTGSAQAVEDDYARSVSPLRMLGDAAAGHGACLVVETHHGYIHDIPPAARKLVDLADHDAVGVNYDAGNIFLNRNGGTIADAFTVLAGKVYYAHLKNLLKLPDSAMCVTHLDAGHIDQMQIMAGLNTQLRSGMVAIEYPATGDGVIAAHRDMAYVRFMKKRLEID